MEGLEGLLATLTGSEGGEDEAREEQRGILVGDDHAPTYDRAAVELDEEEEAALKAIWTKIKDSDDGFRMEEIRPALERREGWNGRQLLAWDPGERRYVDVIRQLEDEAEPDQDLPSFHIDNFYTPYGLDFVALMIANPVQTSFAPGDPDKPRDVIAAEEGERFVEWVNKATDSLTIRRWLGYYFWNDGFGAVYTRLRADKARFGSTTEPEITIEIGETSPASMRCAMCGETSPMEAPACVDCGAPLEMGSPIPPEYGPVPRVARMLEIPKAGVVKTAHGLIEMRRTPGARLVRECGYVSLVEDVPRAHAKALYPQKADELTDKGSGGSSSESYETEARRGLVYGSSRRPDHLLCYERAWLRPWQLEEVGDPGVKAKLKEKFGEGALLVFMGDVLCEAFDESMDDHWTFRFTFPGHGSGVVSAGSATWELQQTANELLNLRVEGARQGIPAMIVNNDILGAEEYAAGRIQPGLIYQAKTPADGGSLRDAVVPTPTANLPSEVGNLEKELGGERAQQRSGIVPALWGGNAGGAGRTLGGYRLMRDQGLMRHGIPWKELEALSNESDLQAVEIYARDGYDDVEVGTQNDSGEWGKQTISIDSLKGEIRIESDDDAGFPMGPAERRAAWFEYSANAAFQGLVLGPQNEAITAENLGHRDLRFPGQDAREQQRREIEALLDEAPSLDPYTGMPSSTVPVDVELEDHAAHIQAIDLWANSREGGKVRLQNSAGWENVKAHWREHLMAIQQRQALVGMLSAPPMPAPGPAPAAGGPPRPGGPRPDAREMNPMTNPVGPGQDLTAPGLGAPVM